MPMNFNLKTKIRANGKEYNNIEEQPPDVRSAYEKAIANLQGSGSISHVNTHTQITFNIFS